MGARRWCWWWMPFQPPFSTAGEQFVKNTSSCRNRNKLMLFYQIKQNPATAPSANPFGWPPTHWIWMIHWINPVGGANGSPWWWCLLGGVVLVLDGIPVLFLPQKTYGVGVFRSLPNPMRGIPVNPFSIRFLWPMTSLITHGFLTTTNTKAGWMLLPWCS